MKRLLFSMLAAVICLTACDMTPDILYRAMVFGDMQGAYVFNADDGCTYRFTNVTSDSGLPTSGRVLALFDARKQVEGRENEFEATLNDFRVPIYKAPVQCLNPEDEAALGANEIRFDNGILSGGHLNTMCTVMKELNDTEEPVVNLQLVQGASSDTLHFILRYNAGKDILIALDSDDVQQYSFYACFPISDLIPEGQKPVVELKWLWGGEWNKTTTTL